MWYYFRLTVWACIWLVAWTVTFPFRRGRDNCLTWAMRQIEENGGYLVIRLSDTDRVPSVLRHPHFGWMPLENEEDAYHYVPKKGTNEKAIPAIWFDGVVEKGDRFNHQ